MARYAPVILLVLLTLCAPLMAADGVLPAPLRAGEASRRLDDQIALLRDPGGQLSIDEVAASVGLGTGTNLRLHFRSVLGTTPSEYRRTFTKGE